MPNYAVNFNGAGNVSIPSWSAASDFDISASFDTPLVLATEGLLGNTSADTFIAVFADGSMQFSIATSINFTTAAGIIQPNTAYLLESVRTSGSITFKVTRESDSQIVIDEAPVGQAATTVFTLIGDTQGLAYSGDIRQVVLNASADSRNYLSELDTGSVWTDTGGGSQDGTLVGLATNGDQWVLYGAPVVGGGTLTTEPLVNNTGQLLSLTSNINIGVYRVDDSTLQFSQTGRTTDAFGIITITDASIVVGVDYRILVSIGTDDGVARGTAV